MVFPLRCLVRPFRNIRGMGAGGSSPSLSMAEAENRAQRVHEHLETLCAVNKGARKRTKRETRSQNQRNPKEQKSKTASIFAKSPIRPNMRKRILSCLFIVLGMFPSLQLGKPPWTPPKSGMPSS